MSPSGTSRHFAAAQYFGRFRSKADIERRAKPAGSGENDPERHRPLITRLARPEKGDVD
jgi:hypothetical protein